VVRLKSRAEDLATVEAASVEAAVEKVIEEEEINQAEKRRLAARPA
jgi:hypothetical protein